MGLLERIQQRLELFRLEQRYTRNRNRRTTFYSNATYVDGEYVYNTPTNTGSSAHSASTTSSRVVPALHASATPAPAPAPAPRTESPSAALDDSVGDTRCNPATSTASSPDTATYMATVAAASKRPKRWSAMPGFGSTSSPSEMPPSWRTRYLDAQDSQ